MKLHFSDSTVSNGERLKVLKSPATPSQLAYTSYVENGVTPNARIVLIHGFTQNGGSFATIASELALRGPYEVICVDLPGHGGSSNLQTGLDETADLLMSFGVDSIWAAYSLGARHLLAMCLKHSGLSWNVILSGVNPGIEDEGERLRRYQADIAIANELNSIEGDQERFREFLTGWMSMALFQPRGPINEDLQNRLKNSPKALASSLAHSSIGKQDNLWPRVQELRGHLTLITGGADAKYLAIAARLASLLEKREQIAVRSEIIDSLGHAAIFDNPQTLIEAVIASSKIKIRKNSGS